MERRRRAAPKFAGVLLAGMALAASACAGPPPPSAPPHRDEPDSDAVRMAAVGDSITDGDSRDLNGGIPGPLSWVSYAESRDIEFVGGWAEWGATTDRMASAIPGPFDADVLVVLAGTNDVSARSHREIGASLRDIVHTAAIDRVILSSVPPNDFARAETVRLNAYLRTFSEEQGWEWVDAAAALRDGDGFEPEMTSDGVHPTAAGARVIGEAIGVAVAE
ncbi:hypothetical protein GCM10009847_14900 [Leucobacter tardus]|uniref:SGNH hydrolase-type esterase domain-containing protein n=1 Tax=Leucobacter tardus TaxID=501483 RepID=A0A939QJ08_9MICO|nr:GDSL-type esterase/lipase family protein [Leucobacter tardus]MBO2989674.1 hypothetical protein [Leucobacter tardus]